MSQWIDEIRTLFAPKGIDILTYPAAKDERKFFWAPEGPFAASNHSPSSIIIFVTQSVSNPDIYSLRMCLQQMYRLYRKSIASCT